MTKKKSASQFLTLNDNYERRFSANSDISHPDGENVLISSVSDNGSTMLSSLRPISGSLQTPFEQQAPCFFMSNFVIVPQHSSSRGYFDFVLPLIKSEPPDSPLSLSFQAVAFASLANRPACKGSGLMHQAIDGYSKALKVVNLALQNPALQKTDQTLASILLLSFFEVCRHPPLSRAFVLTIQTDDNIRTVEYSGMGISYRWCCTTYQDEREETTTDKSRLSYVPNH